ncbi:LytR/AlgR family response regulator transcription factor [Sinomicrobium weinanense]|uniref:Response regulator transcription factor n=1 Tax=Sinomicrobium weinanense TaxID=2842200 RepID=A0A926Q0L3_9FLAO|nr:LytTR family DNA-binding domain-containing protein [Sinomicrobium weinanense]MBC9795022.1 response regulator transcription factor [Sinomicrobium weinanense]MBU3125117.1 LytTR family DNA-binding domain-containing protein [Sinomicrobium weinanense]
MKCVIIDDEPLAIDVLKGYCEKIQFLEVVGTYTNALDAIAVIKEKEVDLIFSDIEMPQISGIEFIHSMDNRPLFIFTTAYAQYAIEGFELNAVDYLVKPIPYHRFVKAVVRAKELMSYKEKNMEMKLHISPSGGILDTQSGYIFVKADYENVRINIDDITYVQGLKDYLKIHITGTNKPILTLLSFKDFMEKVPEGQFLRVHKSFVINIGYIKSIQKNKVVIEDIRIPIGESYKAEFMERLGL